MKVRRRRAGAALALLVETKLDPGVDTWPTYRNIAQRVERQLLCIYSFLELAREHRERIREVTHTARQALLREPLTLFAGYERDRDHPEVRIPMRRIDTRVVEEMAFRDHRNHVNADPMPLPPMIAITRHVDEIAPVLERHAIRHWELD